MSDGSLDGSLDGDLSGKCRTEVWIEVGWAAEVLDIDPSLYPLETYHINDHRKKGYNLTILEAVSGSISKKKRKEARTDREDRSWMIGWKLDVWTEIGLEVG